VYITRHSNLAEVHVIFHMVVDDSLRSSKPYFMFMHEAKVLTLSVLVYILYVGMETDHKDT
jgi:hypothetical protein